MARLTLEEKGAEGQRFRRRPIKTGTRLDTLLPFLHVRSSNGRMHFLLKTNDRHAYASSRSTHKFLGHSHGSHSDVFQERRFESGVPLRSNRLGLDHLGPLPFEMGSLEKDHSTLISRSRQSAFTFG
jgi:hypothetical protein